VGTATLLENAHARKDTMELTVNTPCADRDAIQWEASAVHQESVCVEMGGVENTVISVYQQVDAPPQEVTVYNLVSVGAGLVLWETHAQHQYQVMNVTSYQHLSLLLNSTSIASFQAGPSLLFISCSTAV